MAIRMATSCRLAATERKETGSPLTEGWLISVPSPSRRSLVEYRGQATRQGSRKPRAFLSFLLLPLLYFTIGALPLSRIERSAIGEIRMARIRIDDLPLDEKLTPEQ